MDLLLIYFYLFIYGYAGFSLLCVGFSLVAVNEGCSLIVVHGLLLVVASLAVEHRL